MVRSKSICLLSSRNIIKKHCHSIPSGLILVCFVLVISTQEVRGTRRYLSHIISPVTNLASYVNTDNGLAALRRDFYNVSTGNRKPCQAASQPVNIHKNRYDYLLAYDDTRVVLDSLPNTPGSDYINANYVEGYYRDKEYVATQGPLPNTVNDFWRMIWQLNTRKIVMVANIYEQGKMRVTKYWPDTNATYGEFEVAKLSEHNITIADQVLRKFSLKKKDNDAEIRVIRHFQFTGWPDHGVPEDRRAVVSLVEQARKFRSHDSSPMVVQCSTGVGRTGTVILTDSMVQRAREENKVDFLRRLNQMRNFRIDLVEKEGQYIFAHQAVNDVVNDDGISKYFDEIDKQYEEFDQIDRDNNIMFEPLTVEYAPSSASVVPIHLYTIAFWFFLLSF